MRRISRKRVLMGVLILFSIGCLIRETKILRQVEGLEWMEFTYLGNPLAFTFQNLISFWGAWILLLIVLSETPQNVRVVVEIPMYVQGNTPEKKSPFENVRPKWKRVDEKEES